MKITSKGFQFLLEDVNTQLWNILLRYMTMAEEREMDLVEVLAFLFMLGSLELGRVSGIVRPIQSDYVQCSPVLLTIELTVRAYVRAGVLYI